MDQRQIVFRGRIISIEAGPVQLPTGGEAYYEIVRHPGGAAIVALDEAGRVCLLRQFRPAGGGWVWELPAGRLEPGEPPAATARRELREEAGREATQWEPLGAILSSPGVFAETIHLFLARGLAAVPQQLEHYEVIEVHWLPLAEAVARALSGELNDGKTVVGLLRAAARCGQLAGVPA